MKYVNGTDIPERELTEEESTRDITIERIQNYHYDVGEDFLDQTGEGNAVIFTGWLLHKHPILSKDILKIANKKGKFLEIQSFMDLFGFDEENSIENLYYDFVEFVNQTEHLKKRVNQILIQIDEYYNIK